MPLTNYNAHGLKAYYHDCVMFEEDRIDKHGEPVNYVYAKLKADRVIYGDKYKRALLYAKNHKLEAQKAQDTVRLISLNSQVFQDAFYDISIAYWHKVRDNHVKHSAEWLELAEYFKTKADEH